MNLGPLDMLVLVAYFAAILAVGWWFGRSERTTHDYFLGGRRQHWIVVGLSIIATEVSAITFVIVPSLSFRDDWWYLQMYVGAFVGRMIIVLVLLPAFYGGNVTTVYEYLGQRFGPWTRTTASLMFFASRIVGSGIRLLAASLAIALVFDWPLPWVIIGAASVAVAYTTFGGIKAIIWTDALQACVFIGGGIALVVFLANAIPGGITEAFTMLDDSDKLRVFTFSSNPDRWWLWEPNNTKVFWVLMINATVQNVAALGTDQDLTQRMLTCPDLRRGQRSLIFNAILGLPVVGLFLLIGSLMFAYYAQPGIAAPPADVPPDEVFSYFLSHALPVGTGLKGLLAAGIFAAAMSSLDSALGALSSSAVTDFYRPFIKKDASERHYLRAARFFVFGFGIVLVSVALAFIGNRDLLEAVFGWAGLIFGGMLGVFLLGAITRTRGRDRMNTAAMVSSVAIVALIKWWQDQYGALPSPWGPWHIAWPWWVVIGTFWTFGVAVCFQTPAAVEGSAVRRVHRSRSSYISE